MSPLRDHAKEKEDSISGRIDIPQSKYESDPPEENEEHAKAIFNRCPLGPWTPDTFEGDAKHVVNKVVAEMNP